jgi:hypothetical protein
MPKDGWSVGILDFPAAQQTKADPSKQDSGDKEQRQDDHCFLL